jgi:DNA invertase Pin-like site-specific DNA recombinase
LEDLGMSAFKGKNRTEGALAGFLAAIKKGQITKGSTLLVESVDRLSREDVVRALSQFLEIINAGVTVVTLMDEMVYNTDTIKSRVEILLMSIFSMIRAHEESATKADRISKSWIEKRKKALVDKKPLTSRCPAWLELKNGKYEKRTEREKLIIRIFELASKGLGKRSIAKIFNTENIETWGDGINNSRKANGWHDSYIQKIYLLQD